MTCYQYRAADLMNAFQAHGVRIGRDGDVCVNGQCRGIVTSRGIGQWYQSGPRVTDMAQGHYQSRSYAVRALLVRTDPDLVRRALDHINLQLAAANASTRPCTTCDGVCRWIEDCWTCISCGDEWSPDAGPVYAVPDDPAAIDGSDRVARLTAAYEAAREIRDESDGETRFLSFETCEQIERLIVHLGGPKQDR